jgi:hypothetical protein
MLVDSLTVGLRKGDHCQVFFKPDQRPFPTCATIFGTFHGLRDGFYEITDANLSVPREELDKGKQIDKYDWLINKDSIIAIEERRP